MKEHLLVDGYNVIFQSPELSAYENLEHSRERLINILIEFAALTGQSVFLVFDAHLVRGGIAKVESREALQVLYTGAGETADMAIERLTGKLVGLGGRVYVVTADYAQQRLILGQGAYRMTPREFWQAVGTLKKDTAAYTKNHLPADNYLENRLEDQINAVLKKWQRKKSE